MAEEQGKHGGHGEHEELKQAGGGQNKDEQTEEAQAVAKEQPKKREGKQLRGFAVMDPAKQREIASKGGRAAHAKGTAHEFTPEQARIAGRKGGLTVSRDRAHMAAIGRKGGEAVSQDRAHMAAIGRKGGEAVSQDRAHMAQIGREGGEAVSGDRAHMAEIGREGGRARGAAAKEERDRLEREHEEEEARRAPQ